MYACPEKNLSGCYPIFFRVHVLQNLYSGSRLNEAAILLSLRLILNPKSTDWHPLVCNKQVKRNGKLASAMMAKKSSINFERRRIFFKIRNPFFFCVCQNWVKKSSQRLIYGCHLGFQEEVFADAAMLMCKVVWLIPQHKVYCTCNLVMISISILFRLFAFKSIKDE